MIELKQKTPLEIKLETNLKQKKKSIIKTYIKKNKDLSNINFFNSDETIYNNLEQENTKKYIFKDSIPIFIIIGISLIFIFTILYIKFNNIFESNSDTFIFIFLIISLFSIITLILLKNIFIDSKFK